MVAACSLAWTPAWISAFQSMLERLVEPPVFEDEDVDDAVVAAEDVFVALLTVIVGPFVRTTGRCGAGPSHCRSIQERHGSTQELYSDQPRSFRRYCGIWLAAVSAETAAWVFTIAEESIASSCATSTSWPSPWAGASRGRGSSSFAPGPSRAPALRIQRATEGRRASP